MKINRLHIEEAAKLLIGGKVFDSERIEFITNLDTCDLLAVPGSGKTTALLAKLYCLAKQMPFNDGSGILVLAHTNNAVHEIENKLKKHCPHLFEYPNFVGTIQSFVNKYLASQGCFEQYGSYISKNDNDFYEREAIKFYHTLKWKKTEPKNLLNKLYGVVNISKKNIEFKEGCENIKVFLKYFEFDLLQRKMLYNEKTIYSFKGKSEIYYLELEKWRESLLEKGILTYKDSFNLANLYKTNYPRIKSILQDRFKFVFVDEMQDLEKYQIDIIENIFSEENSRAVIQRIGDPNQAIYNSTKKVKIECDWKERNPLFLTGSNRLTKFNSNLINRFILDSKKDKDGIPKFIVESKGEDGLKPHLIVFSHETKHLLKNKFKELIIKQGLHNCDKKKEDGYKIIGWSAVWEEIKEGNKNIRLQDVFPEYSKESRAKKEDFSTLSKHIQLFDYNKTTLETVRKSILNALIHILLLENKKYKTIIRGKEVERRYSKSEMINHIKDFKKDQEYLFAYEVFKEKLFKWCFDLVTKKNYEEIFKSIKEFINKEFKEWFFEPNDIFQPSTQLFILEFKKESKPEKETINEDDFRIDIATIHSVKGQTHCATMYIETFVYEYESKKAQIKNSLLKGNHSFIVGEKGKPAKGKQSEKDARGKEALKMMYVGFSRPTDLLCYAVLEENVKDDIEKFKDSGWAVMKI